MDQVSYLFFLFIRKGRSGFIIGIKQSVGEVFGKTLGNFVNVKIHKIVTRNVVTDHSGKIVFLTRLFEQSEYHEMIKVIERIL